MVSNYGIGVVVLGELHVRKYFDRVHLILVCVNLFCE